MISRTVEYALRAIVWLASQSGEPRTTREVAHATRVPSNYLSKVLQTLVEGEIIRSQRGLGGGFVLMRDAKSLSVLDVVNAVDPLQRIRSCPLGLNSHSIRLCALHQRLDDAMAGVERAFAASMIAEFLSDTRSEHPLCSTPAAELRRNAPRGAATVDKRGEKRRDIRRTRRSK
ncbi:MAG: Rrf2 family transcriptional regulator [Phycisphaerae bacterium]